MRNCPVHAIYADPKTGARVVDTDACIGCGLCRDDCPASNLSVAGGKAAPLTQACIMCAHCVAVCPTNAVSISGFDEEPRPLDGAEALEPARLLAAIGARRSMRRFAEGPVSDEAIADIVEAGRLTPTGKNAQDVSYIVLRERLDRCEQLAVSPASWTPRRAARRLTSISSSKARRP